PEEKLAWARTHAVEPPTYAETSSEQGWHTTRLRDRECGQADTPCHACCQHDQTAPSKSCCNTASSTAERLRSVRPATPPRWRWVPGMSALRCQGLSTLWVSASAVVPPPCPVTWSPTWPCLESLSIADETAFVLPARPPIPPPRSFPV